MRAQNITIFDEFVAAGATSAGSPVYTSAKLNGTLGAYNMIAVQAVLDNLSGATTFELVVEHSADARIWLRKNRIAGATSEISVSVTGTAPITEYWSDACDGVSKVGGTMTGPMLAFVRCSMYFGSASGGHVRVYATLRDK